MLQLFQTCSSTDCFLVIMYDMDNSEIIHMLYIDMMVLASNAFYPISFRQELPVAKITVTGVSQVSASSASVSELNNVCVRTYCVM